MSNTLTLYQQILRAAKIFPSIKRDKIISEIRLGFRENASLKDESKLKIALDVAYKGLGQLSQFSNLSSQKGAWVVNMDTEPMPKPQEVKVTETKRSR